MGRYVISNQEGGGFSFTLSSSKGEVLGKSTVFSSKQMCMHGADIMEKIVKCPVVLKTAPESVFIKNPKFEISCNKKKEYNYVLVSRNGRSVISGTGYESEDLCRTAIKSVIKNASSTVSDETKRKPRAKKLIQK